MTAREFYWPDFKINYQLALTYIVYNNHDGYVHLPIAPTITSGLTYSLTCMYCTSNLYSRWRRNFVCRWILYTLFLLVGSVGCIPSLIYPWAHVWFDSIWLSWPLTSVILEFRFIIFRNIRCWLCSCLLSWGDNVFFWFLRWLPFQLILDNSNVVSSEYSIVSA